MRLSIRYQVIGLLGVLLLGALSTYLYLATSLLTGDKRAYLYDFNSQLAGTLAEEVHAHVTTLVDKLLYFGAEQSLLRGQAGADRPARTLFGTDADQDVLSLEVWEPKKDGHFERTYRYADPGRMAAFDLDEDALAAAAQQAPVQPKVLEAEPVMLLNASLPPATGLLRLVAMDPDKQRIVVADLRPDRFLRLFSRPTLAEVSLVDGNGRTLVHPDPAQMTARADLSALPVVQQALEGKLKRSVHEFDTPKGPVIGAFSSVGIGRLSVVVQVPRSEALKASRELIRRSVLFAILVMMVALVVTIFFSRRLVAPLRRLEETMAIISQGDFGVEVPVTSQNEIGRLAAAFNRMSRELSAREALLMEANAQLIQSEKLSVLGEMSAGLVHEVKNPMVGIVGFSELGEGAKTLAEAKEYFGLIRSDAQRANEILQNVLAFARPEQVEMKPLDPNEVVQGALRLVAHQLNMSGVKVEARYAEGLPKVRGNANQLRQVLVNLMMNAGHAMEGCPQKALSVSTSAENRSVRIEVRDTGVGMAAEVRERLFRPFFTTKPKGKGTGLGLSVSRGIVLQHRGEISVESEPGQGATFRILLPAAPPPAEAAAALT